MAQPKCQMFLTFNAANQESFRETELKAVRFKEESAMENEKRLEAFEKMLLAVQENYEITDQKMKRLKAEGREKSATYRQLMGNKMQYQNMLSMYEIYGLLEKTGD